MISKISLLGLGLALCVGAVSAEEDSIPEKKPVKKLPFKISVANFDRMRDPFTFMVSKQPEYPKGPCFIDPDYLMRDSCVKAEWYFKERRFMEAVSACEKGLKVATDYKDSPRVYENEELLTRIARLKKAAERMIKRYETEDVFEKLKLETQGVFSTANALIGFNTDKGQVSKMVRVGDKILDPESKAPTALTDAPTVRDIQPRRVIVDYRGYKIELPVSSVTDEVETAK